MTNRMARGYCFWIKPFFVCWKIPTWQLTNILSSFNGHSCLLFPKLKIWKQGTEDKLVIIVFIWSYSLGLWCSNWPEDSMHIILVPFTSKLPTITAVTYSMSLETWKCLYLLLKYFIEKVKVQKSLNNTQWCYKWML